MQKVSVSLLTALVLAGPVASQDVNRIAQASLLDGWRQDDGTHVAALRVKLEEGWHTYWRVPGQVGIPWEFDWSGSNNLQNVAVQWPNPEIQENFGFVSFVFEDELVLPVRLTPVDPAKPIDVSLTVSYGVCSDICIPATADVAGEFMATRSSVDRTSVERALTRGAQDAGEGGITSVACHLTPEDAGFSLVADVRFSHKLPQGQYVVVESDDPHLWVDFAETKTSGDQVVGRSRIEGKTGNGVVLDRSSLRVTVLDSTRAVETWGCRAPG